MIFTVFCVMVGVIGSEGGHLRYYLPLGLPHPLIISRELLQAQGLLRPITYAVKDATTKDVSYSLSYEDYLYLKRHKVHGKDSPYNPEPTEPGPIIVDAKALPERVNKKVPRLDPVLKRSAKVESINGFCSTLESAPVSPVVHKHVYFHVPPPDFEEKPAAPRVITPAKKNVNILFIKVPSQEPNRAYLKQLLQSSPVEDKTLIYVLSKKENIPQPVVLPPKPSAPEVYFVKYKTSNDIEPINNELSPNLLQNVSPVLERRRASRDP